MFNKSSVKSNVLGPKQTPSSTWFGHFPDEGSLLWPRIIVFLCCSCWTCFNNTIGSLYPGVSVICIFFGLTSDYCRTNVADHLMTLHLEWCAFGFCTVTVKQTLKVTGALLTYVTHSGQRTSEVNCQPTLVLMVPPDVRSGAVLNVFKLCSHQASGSIAPLKAIPREQ